MSDPTSFLNSPLIGDHHRWSVGNVLVALALIATLGGGVISSYVRLNAAEIEIVMLKGQVNEMKQTQISYEQEMRGHMQNVLDLLTDVRIKLEHVLAQPVQPRPRY